MLAFQWDRANLEHIERHHVTREEAEEVFKYPMLWVDSHTEDDEIRFVELGRTASGRILKMVTTERNNMIRVVTAFNAPARDVKTYLSGAMEEQT